jgi:hypothetical protein
MVFHVGYSSAAPAGGYCTAAALLTAAGPAVEVSQLLLPIGCHFINISVVSASLASLQIASMDSCMSLLLAMAFLLTVVASSPTSGYTTVADAKEPWPTIPSLDEASVVAPWAVGYIPALHMSFDKAVHCTAVQQPTDSDCPSSSLLDSLDCPVEEFMFSGSLVALLYLGYLLLVHVGLSQSAGKANHAAADMVLGCQTTPLASAWCACQVLATQHGAAGKPIGSARQVRRSSSGGRAQHSCPRLLKQPSRGR